MPSLELSGTLEVYEAMLCVVVDREAIEALKDDEKALLNPQRLHKWSLFSVRDVASRRYQMQHIAIEFFFGDGSTCRGAVCHRDADQHRARLDEVHASSVPRSRRTND